MKGSRTGAEAVGRTEARPEGPSRRRAVTAVALGGAVGALLRWSLGELVPDGDGFPWTTFAINVGGCFTLALLPALAVVRRHPALPLLLGTGMLGGFTTLSTGAEQSRELFTSGAEGVAVAYLAGTLAVALLAVHLAQHLTTRGQRLVFEADEGNE